MAGKKADGTRKVKIPKKIGGVKLPKELRRSAEGLIERANSPEGRAAIGSGLGMAAAAFTAAAAARARAAAEKPRPVADPDQGGDAARTPADDLGRVGDAIHAAVDGFVQRLTGEPRRR